MIHGEPAEAMSKDQDFPVSIEVQFLGGTGEGERTTANLCTPGTNVVMHGELVTRHCTNSSSRTYHGEEWVTVETEVRGGELIRHLIDGQVVLEYEQPQLDDREQHSRQLAVRQGGLILTEGTISLQSESHPCEFRKVEIMELPEAGWTDLLAGGDPSKHWHTKGNWVLGKDGAVKLTPRKGERGWRPEERRGGQGGRARWAPGD